MLDGGSVRRDTWEQLQAGLGGSPVSLAKRVAVTFRKSLVNGGHMALRCMCRTIG